MGTWVCLSGTLPTAELHGHLGGKEKALLNLGTVTTGPQMDSLGNSDWLMDQTLVLINSMQSESRTLEFFSFCVQNSERCPLLGIPGFLDP